MEYQYRDGSGHFAYAHLHVCFALRQNYSRIKQMELNKGISFAKFDCNSECLAPIGSGAPQTYRMVVFAVERL